MKPMVFIYFILRVFLKEYVNHGEKFIPIVSNRKSKKGFANVAIENIFSNVKFMCKTYL